MHKGRLEAFSDGVIAILITIMVLELKIPHDPSWDAIKALWPVFLSYIVSFINLGIYWGNHHHLMHTIKEVRGGNPLGKSPSLILVIPDPICHCLDG